MKFKCQYKSIYPRTPNGYWRTISADTHAEASRIAERYVRAGYRLILLIQDKWGCD